MTVFGISFGLDESLAVSAAITWGIGFVALRHKGAIACGKWWAVSAILTLSLAAIHP